MLILPQGSRTRFACSSTLGWSVSRLQRVHLLSLTRACPSGLPNLDSPGLKARTHAMLFEDSSDSHSYLFKAIRFRYNKTTFF
jgi:hypothetical protein